MIPTISFADVRTRWEARMRSPDDPLRDFERAGVAVGNTSQGLRGYDWTAYYFGNQVFLYREDLGDESKVSIVTRADILRIALAFDQNMRPVLAWTDTSGSFLWRYNAALPGYDTLALPGAAYPCLTLDEKRPEGVSNSDVIVSYTKGNDLYCRVQREAYGVEHLLYEDVPDPRLLAFGMTKELRLQWRLAL